YYLQQSGLKDTSRFTSAKLLYQEILEIDPNNAAAAFNQGFIELEYRLNYRKALAHFSLAIELFPQYYQAYYNRGLCHESLDEVNLALADYDMALQLEPTYTRAALGKGRILDGE
ncbi:MAG: tetratricopeptide repeat protein, partial [Flavobacteriales bacterium]|nr:tetratricopeptide repeat protein [Flavobacteriales bacterium]